MAAAPRCSICTKYKFDKKTCDEYPEGIPKDIYLEDEECDKHSEVQVDNDGTYPIAGGR